MDDDKDSASYNIAHLIHIECLSVSSGSYRRILYSLILASVPTENQLRIRLPKPTIAMSFFLKFIYTQLFVTPPYLTQPFTSQTVIVTGSNVGLGLEAARHFTRLGASKVILAVRSTSKGETAKADIEASTSRTGVVEVWPLDLSSYESVKEFAKRAEGLERLDALVENAGVIPSGSNFDLAEDNETTITTNVVSTFLLALLLMPTLRRTARKFNTQPRLVIVSSEVHAMTTFPERNSENIFATLNDKKTAVISDRYYIRYSSLTNCTFSR